MVGNLKLNKILWGITAVPALLAGVTGLANPGIYTGVVSEEIIPGVISQDLLTIIATVSILLLIWRTGKSNYRLHIILTGLTGYLFYAYGIYTIEQVYNGLYFVYMAVFGMAFYSVIISVASIRSDVLSRVRLSEFIRRLSSGFSLGTAALFSGLWIAMLIPLLREGNRIENLFSVFILDLCFIMPAFVIMAVMLMKKRGMGVLLTPALFVLGFTLLLPVGLAELFKPLYGLSIDPGGMIFYLGISILFLVLAAIHLKNLRIAPREPAA